MLTHSTSERLRSLGLVAMAQALEEQRRQPDLDSLGFEERLTLLVEREATGREDRRLRARLKFAGLRQSACVEDIDWRAARGLDRAVFQRLATGDWINRHEGVHLTGPTGVGKSWLACALGHKACRDGRSVLYHRLPRLLEALGLGPRGWALRPHAEGAGPRPAAHTRRLGPDPIDAGAAARPA